MANIKKSFNFRNGVQVDDDNLKVSATGLVGIGTTVPTEALDVRGNLVISGVSSAITAQAGVMTVTTLNPTEIIGAGVSISSGIITASSGIVTFYGDARYLQGMPTSQWEDTNTGLGVSSIYNTGGTVGIATTNPVFAFQVGNDVNSGQKGVGISSFGDIKVSGIITATGFVGGLTGNVTGNLIGVADSTTQLETARTIGGVLFDGTSNIDLAGVNIAGNQNTSGTAANLSGTPNILINNLSASGVSTFSEDIITGVGATVGIGTHVFFGDNIKATFGSANEVKMFHKPDTNDFRTEFADTNYVIMTRALDFKNQAGNKATITAFEPGGISEVRLFNDGNEKLRTTGFGVTIFNQLDTTNIVASGIITATTELNSPLIGVGTDTPANEIQVRKPGDAEIQITSDTGTAGLTVGRESGTGNTNNAEFRYGGGAGANYSTPQSLDIINYGIENFNYYLSANNPGGVVGDYHWHKGLNSARLMTLTNTGRLGVGETQPTTTLHVQGISTVTSNSFVGGNFNVSGNSVIAGNLTLGGSLGVSAISADITGNVTGNLTGNVNSISGISTFISVGINTTSPLSADLDVTNGDAVFKNVGIGSTQPDGILDVSGTESQASKKFILLPKVSAGSTSVIQSDSVEGGALIYNTTLRKLQFYNGTNWETVTSVEVTG